MEATKESPAEVLNELEEGLSVTHDVPERGDKSIRCQTCGAETWMHFYFMDGLMSFCSHHGHKNQEKLESLGGTLLADYSDKILET